MKTCFFTAVILLIGALPAFAEDPSYEADYGLIAPGGFFVLFYNSQGPLSYTTQTLKDLPKGATLLGEVKSSDCQHQVSIPIFTGFSQQVSISGALGNGSFKKAMTNIKRDYPQVDGIFDVKIDINELYLFFGIYNWECTEIVARGFRVQRQSK